MNMQTFSSNINHNPGLACELCQADSWAFKRKNDYLYYKCEKCFFIFIDPPLTDSELDNLYSEQTYQNTNLENKHLKLAKRILKHTESKLSLKNVLDIGCQNGDFLNELSKSELFNLYGVEGSYQSAEQASKNKLLSIKNEMFRSELYSNIQFDFVVLGDVIEHLNNPKEFLLDCKLVMLKNGQIAISTPNTNCPYVKINNFVSKFRTNYKLAWLTPPYHLKYFSSDNLDNLLKEIGFIKIDFFYTSSKFKYELAESQIFLGFRDLKFLKKLRTLISINLSLFLFSYLASKFAVLLSIKKFSYTAVYQRID